MKAAGKNFFLPPLPPPNLFLRLLQLTDVLLCVCVHIHVYVDLDNIIMYIWHVLINALGAHMIHINLNMIFYTHVEHSPTKTIYIKYYKKYI